MGYCRLRVLNLFETRSREKRLFELADALHPSTLCACAGRMVMGWAARLEDSSLPLVISSTSTVLDMKYSAVGPRFGVMGCDALFSAWKKWPVLLLASFDSAKLSYEGFGATSSRYRSGERRSDNRLTIWQPGGAFLVHDPGQPRRQPVARHAMCKNFAQSRTAESHPQCMNEHTNTYRVWVMDIINATAHMALVS